MSFTDMNLQRMNSPPNFIGLENYFKLTQDSLFRLALFNSMIFTVCSVGGGFGLGFALALLLNEKLRFRGFFRGISLIPWIIPSVVTSLLFTWVLQPVYGPVNFYLAQLGLPKIPWFNIQFAMLAVVITTIWRYAPLHTLFLLAGLQAIPVSLYEAAEVDGAGKLGRFRHITLPSLKFVITIDTILQTIWVFKNVDIVYVMTGGGPIYATELVPIRIWKSAFELYNIGYAASEACVMLVILLVFAIVYMKIGKVD
jgi:multiple sugar transport system permease protein